MQISVKLLQLLPMQSGIGKNGTWKKQELIVETLDAQYPKKICISVWGDKINMDILQINAILQISFEIESREFNGRWYTDVRAWKIELDNQNNINSKDMPLKAFESIHTLTNETQKNDEDLPF